MMSIYATWVLFVIGFNILPSTLEANIVKVNQHYPVAERDWFVTREMWQAAKLDSEDIKVIPSRLVVIQHTVTPECRTLSTCAREMRKMQTNNINSLKVDIPYNFVIGNDGVVYEGRGWGKVGAHTLGYNFCTMGLAFIGDYRDESYSRVTPLQEMRAHMLFEEGLKLGYLHANFHVLGAKDLRATLSPGDNLYRAIRNWPRYDHTNRYKNRTCDQINRA